MADPLIGKTIGQYQIVQLVGKGGMATVYKAYQPALNRYVALKVLPEHLAQDEQFVARFKQEALAAAALRHPNIIVIQDVGQEGNLQYVAMELLEGRPLSDVVQQSGRLDPQRVVRIFEQMASALDLAHRRGVIHRDLKPANIFIGVGDHVTLLDFGLAKALSRAASLTRAGAVIGAPEYMSPEQVQARPLDPRSDIYSLGVVLYQMLTGYVPFGGESASAIMNAHVGRAPTPPSKATASVTPEIEAVVMRALAKNPHERFASVKDMAQALAQAVAGRGPAPASYVRPGAPYRAPTAVARKSSLVWPILFGAAGLALIGVVVIVLLVGGILYRGGLGVPATSTPTIQVASVPTSAAVEPLWTSTPIPAVTAKSSPTSTQTATPPPRPSPVPTVANESRTVTTLSPAAGAKLKSPQITFKWSGGALQSGETFMVEVIPYLAEMKGDCVAEEVYGPRGHLYSPSLTAHEWTTDITNVPPGIYKSCAGPVEWIVHIKDAHGNIVQSTPRSLFEWSPL